MSIGTKQVDFDASDFTLAKPLFASEIYDNALIFASKIVTLHLNDLAHTRKIIEFMFAEHSDSNIDYVSVIIKSANASKISIGYTIDGAYGVENRFNSTEFILFYANLDPSEGPKNFYVIVNGDNLNYTDDINLNISVAKFDSAPTSTSVSFSYDCDPGYPIYEVSTGLHVYSAYDAVDSRAKLRTDLYSRTPYASWNINTVVYASHYFNNPALPYYYGKGDKVYKVGSELDRSYGILRTYNTIGHASNNRVDVDYTETAPGLYYDPVTQTSLACVIPVVYDVGIIKEISLDYIIPQPSLYRYYMGYNRDFERPSNDSVFTYFYFPEDTHDPVTGAVHALQHLSETFLTGYWGSIERVRFYEAMYTNDGIDFSQLLKGSFLPLPLGAAWYFNILPGPNNPIYGSWFVGIPLAELAIAAYIIYQAYLINKYLQDRLTTKIHFEECKVYLHHFATSPYIEVGTELYRYSNLYPKNEGYHCDGVYFYHQNATGVINSKVLSSTVMTQRVLGPNYTILGGFQYSITADIPTYVTDYEKLIILPYCSGKPTLACETSGSIYYSAALYENINVAATCGLMHGDDVIIDIQNIISCISQSDANAKALVKFNEAKADALANLHPATPFTNEEYTAIEVAFTHELKIENSTLFYIFYDSRYTGLGINKLLYYDVYGCHLVMDGYYSIEGTTPYRTFYHTTNGAIDSIQTMAYYNSTTTNLNNPIITTNQNHISNWYMMGNSNTEVVWTCINLRDIPYNTNTNLVKGMQYGDNFLLIENNNYITAYSKWYNPIHEWLTINPFFYYTDQTFVLSIEEYCTYSGPNSPRGFNIVSKRSGIKRPTTDPITLNISVHSIDGHTATFNGVVTSNIISDTFISYGNNVTDVVDSITITSIVSQNPLNRSTYQIGTTTLCISGVSPTVSVKNGCGSSLLSTTLGGTLLWSTGATTSSIRVITPGTYTVTRTIAGVTSSPGSGVAAPVTVPATPSISVVNNCGNSVLTAIGYTGTLVWSTGATTSSITVYSGGTYTLTQTVGSCTSNAASQSVSITSIPSTPIVTVANNCGTSTLSASGYTGTLLWNNGAITMSITVVTPGTYTVTQTIGGCTSQPGSGIAAPIAIPATPVVQITAPTCYSNGFTTITNYNSLLTYVFTPTGPTVGTGGLISNNTLGTSYTVTAGNGSCPSSPSLSFTNLAMLITPSTAGTITGLTTVFTGTTYSYSIATIANATSYSWSLPTGATILTGTGTNSITVNFATVTTGIIKVRGVNSCGNGTYSPDLNVTISTDVTAPSTPTDAGSTGFISQDKLDYTVLLRWNASSDNVGVTGYNIYLNGVFYDNVGPSIRSYQIDGAVYQGNVTLGVAAYDAATNISGVMEYSLYMDTIAPSAPRNSGSGLVGTGAPETWNDYELSWREPEPNCLYNIYVDEVIRTATMSTSITLYDLPSGSHTLWVTAVDDGGNESIPMEKTTQINAYVNGTYHYPSTVPNLIIGKNYTVSLGSFAVLEEPPPGILVSRYTVGNNYGIWYGIINNNFYFVFTDCYLTEV